MAPERQPTTGAQHTNNLVEGNVKLQVMENLFTQDNIKGSVRERQGFGSVQRKINRQVVRDKQQRRLGLTPGVCGTYRTLSYVHRAQCLAVVPPVPQP